MAQYFVTFIAIFYVWFLPILYTYEMMTKYNMKIYLQKVSRCLIVIYHTYYLRIFFVQHYFQSTI